MHSLFVKQGLPAGASTHEPFEQVAPDGQASWHEPQLFTSVEKSTQPPLHAA